MSTYVVTYDLHKRDQNYSCLIEKLKSHPTHWHAQGSVWFIETTNSAVEVRDGLMPCLDANDRLIVARLSGEAAWTGYDSATSDWIRGRLNAQFVR